jgi:hypothetical protein
MELANPGGNGKRNAVWVQRIHALNRIFESRYGCVFPNDDAGLEDLKILAHHYYWGDPLAMARIIKRRAPWADVQAIVDEIAADPKKWTSAELGEALNFTGAEWRHLRIRTITPVDMSLADRADFNRVRANGRRRQKRRMQGVRPRAEYEATRKPWVAEGISKATWYRRRTRETSVADIMCTVLARPVSQGWAPEVRSRAGGYGSPPTPKPALPDLSNPLSAFRYWSPPPAKVRLAA